jgi:competence protein ComEA
MMRKLLVAVALALPVLAAAVDANSGNRAQLEQLRGIGPPLAEALLAERERNGAYKDWADLMSRVSGIRDAKARALSAAGLTVSGAPYEAPPR